MDSAESRVAERKSNNNPTPAPTPPMDPSLRISRPANVKRDNRLWKLARDMTTTSEKPLRRRRSPAPTITEALLRYLDSANRSAYRRKRQSEKIPHGLRKKSQNEDRFSPKPERDRQEKENVRKESDILLNQTGSLFYQFLMKEKDPSGGGHLELWTSESTYTIEKTPHG